MNLLKKLFFLTFISLSFSDIIYTELNDTLRANATSRDSRDQTFIDINQDGTTDFALHNYFGNLPQSIFFDIFLIPLTDNFVKAEGKNVILHSKSEEISIADSLKLVPYPINISNFPLIHGENHYEWLGINGGYAGVAIVEGGEKHFGWVKISIDSSGNSIVHSFAYETNPNSKILMGDGEPITSIFLRRSRSLITNNYKNYRYLVNGKKVSKNYYYIHENSKIMDIYRH